MLDLDKKKETYKKLWKSEKKINIAGNFLDCKYFSKYYKLIETDLSKQKGLENLNITQQINFVGNLERDG